MRRRALLALVLSVATAVVAHAESTVSFTYDANGNLRSKTDNGVVWTYIYDSRNLLQEVQRDGLLVESYQYDLCGHRIKKAGADGIVRYVWDGDRILLRTDGFGNTIAKYSYSGNQLLSIEHVTEGTAFVLFDGLGSVVALTKADGSIAARYSYEAWGPLRRHIGQSSNSFLFTGHELDEATDLYYAKGRYYFPELGRFLTEDPASGQILDPLSLHKYLYARSNPTRFVDPDGREAMEVTAGGQARVLNGQELQRILIEQEGLSVDDASRIVILSQLGSDIGADKTAAMTPYILGAGELTGILPAERALANPYVQGSLQVAGGAAEVGLGVAAAGTGPGVVASPVLAAHGGDLIGTGIRTLTTGQAQETLTHRGIRASGEALGADPSAAGFAADLGEVGVTGFGAAGAATALLPRSPTSFGEIPVPKPPGNQAMVVTESSTGGVRLVPWQVGGQGLNNADQAARWVDEGGNLRAGRGPGMSADAYNYQSATPGARSNPWTGRGQAPALNYTDATGNPATVKFDGVEGAQFVDRKTAIHTGPKTRALAHRQSEALAQNGFTGVWEVPSPTEAARAQQLLTQEGVTNITVKVAPPQ